MTQVTQGDATFGKLSIFSLMGTLWKIESLTSLTSLNNSDKGEMEKSLRALGAEKGEGGLILYRI